MKRVIFVITSLGPGGAEKQAVKVMNHLAARYEIIVLKLLDNHFRGNELDSRIQVIDLKLNKGNLIARLMFFRKTMRRLCPDLVVSFLFHPNFLTRIIKLSGVSYPLINSVRNNVFGGRFRELSLRVTDVLAQKIIVNTESSREILVSRKISHWGKIRVIYNGVEPIELLKYTCERKEDSAFTWLNIASFSEQKNHRCLIYAFSKVLSVHPDSRLILVGEGPLRYNIESMVRELGIQSAVNFLGIRKDVAELLMSVDAFVLSSKWEGLPNVVLEAGIAGLPVVSTDVGGVKEIIPDASHGRVVEKDSVEALAIAMCEIIGFNRVERHEMGLKLKARVCRLFEMTMVMNQWSEIIEEFCE